MKFRYSEKATKFDEISIFILTLLTVSNVKMKISSKFVAFSEYLNINKLILKNIFKTEQMKLEF